MTGDEKVAKIKEIFNDFTKALGGLLLRRRQGPTLPSISLMEERDLAKTALKEIGKVIADDDGRRFESHG